MREMMNWDEALAIVDQPAFVADPANGETILKANRNAAALQLTPGTKLRPLMENGWDEYREYIAPGQTGTFLYTSLRVMGVWRNVTVRMTDYGAVFTLDREEQEETYRMLALAAQELRKPLGDAMLAADQLFRDLSRWEDPAHGEQMAQINRGLYRILRAVGNMSDVMRFRDSELSLEMTEIGSFVAEICEHANALGGERMAHISFRCPQELIFAWIDRDKIERAIYNLLSNALRYTRPRGEVYVSLTKTKDRVTVCISDTGEGLKESAAPDPCSAHSQAPGIKDSREGLGLGLTLVRQIAQMHGGTLVMTNSGSGGVLAALSFAAGEDREAVLRSAVMRIVDYFGGRDHGLIELSDVLSYLSFDAGNVN